MSLPAGSVVTIPFVNQLNSGYLGTTFKGWTGNVAVTNPSAGASQTVFVMLGMCATKEDAATCMRDYYSSQGAGPASTTCNTKCFLTDAVVRDQNPYYGTFTTTTFQRTLSVTTTGNIANYFAKPADVATLNSFTFFLGSLSSVPVTVTLTFDTVSTTLNVPPPPPSPPPAPPSPPLAAWAAAPALHILAACLLLAVMLLKHA